MANDPVATALPVDDGSIADHAELWRRVPPWHFNKTDPRGTPSSAAFDDHPDGSSMSVALAEIVRAEGGGPEDVLGGLAGFALASITAGLIRQLGLGVVRSPAVGGPVEHAHAEIFGKKTDSIRKKLARGCAWVVPPAAAP